MASPFAAPNVQQAAPEPSGGAGAAGGEAKMAGTANRSVLMVEASSLSRAGSSPGPSRAPSHISQSSMAGAKAEQDEDQQMQEVLSIARELGVFPTCPADLEAQPSWVPPSLGAPPPPLPRADQRRSEESAQSQLQLLLPRSHAPGLTRGHSHPPPASTQQQQQQLLQPAPQLRREEWSAGGGAAPPALLAQPGMQQQPAGRQLSADQLFELAHLLQRAKAAGIQLPQLASWPTQAPGPQAQPPVQPQKLPPQHLHGAAQHQQQLHGLVHQQQQQQVPLQLPRRTETATFEHRSAMLAGLRRQVSADAVHAQHAQQTQHAHHAQQAPPAQQAQQAAMHRQQLMLLEAAQAEQRKQLVQTQHAELLQLEQARQARQARQAQQAQQAQHTWLAADARRAAPPAPISQNTLQFAGPQQQRTAYAAPPPPLQRLPTAQQPPLQQGAASLYAQQQALLAQQRAEQQRWADAALSLLSQATR
ncbi:hypothetical protein COHA_009652 [Chlorella ohadii]|uniref:Uncharacterized protein n=1 Tax=Chlorella ohadii TaxID=2649997 RepID=A0AAD5DHY0_9CHLO|nr:hypothetical protein COHA_009652 [Chlorella ohadii]